MDKQVCTRCGEILADNNQCSFCFPALKTSGATADVTPVAAQVKKPGAFLVNLANNERYLLNHSVSKVGRDKANNISLHEDSYISRHHAWVLFIKGSYFVEDLGSTNGTLLNGEVLSERKQIFPGDRIKFGHTELVFEII